MKNKRMPSNVTGTARTGGVGHYLSRRDDNTMPVCSGNRAARRKAGVYGKKFKPDK